MQVIKIHHPLKPEIVPNTDVVLAMGFFDGVHRGHQKVILTAKQIADKKGLPLAVMTFEHRPGIVYEKYPTNGVQYLTPLPRKLELFEQLGVNYVFVVNLTSALSELSPQAFVDQYLIGFHTRVAVAGFDHTYGADPNVANMQHLPEFAKGRFEVVTIDKQTLTADEKIGSTKIRELLDNGDVATANQLFGYEYQTSGIVVHGFARGRTLGFPTANVVWPDLEWIPAIGVYVVEMQIGDTWYGGMASVGHNVTFGDHNQKTLEIYLFDFKAMIYGEDVKVRWLKRLRGEVKFNGADELVAQMHQDQRDSQEFLKQRQASKDKILQEGEKDDSGWTEVNEINWDKL